MANTVLDGKAVLSPAGEEGEATAEVNFLVDGDIANILIDVDTDQAEETKVEIKDDEYGLTVATKTGTGKTVFRPRFAETDNAAEAIEDRYDKHTMRRRLLTARVTLANPMARSVKIIVETAKTK